MPYLARKFGILLFTLWVAATLNFVLPRMVPGDPVGALLAKYQGRLEPSAIQSLRIAYGLDDGQGPLAQYFTYLWKVVQADFGRSITQFPTPVIDVVRLAAPWTVGLVGVATVLAFVIGSSFGLFSGWRRGGKVADALPIAALFLNSMPYFWFALLILFVFAYKWSWLPLGGGLDPFPGAPYSATWWKSLLTHSVLPGLTIVVTSAGGWLLTMRNNVVSVMNEDYLVFARAKGLTERHILNRYVVRNALIPSLTGFGMALGFVVGGSLLTEVVFSYPGLGFFLYQAVVGLDYPLMQAIFLLISASVLIANFLIDALYAVLDPRVRTGGTP